MMMMMTNTMMMAVMIVSVMMMDQAYLLKDKLNIRHLSSPGAESTDIAIIPFLLLIFAMFCRCVRCNRGNEKQVYNFCFLHNKLKEAHKNGIAVTFGAMFCNEAAGEAV